MKIVKIVGALLVLLVVLGGAGVLWASSGAQAKLDRSIELHEIELAIPMPLTEAERAELGEELTDEEVEAIALERAIERGEHLTTSRYVCSDCHGENFGGGVMVEDPAMGSLLGPNLTLGEGSVTRDYTAADWDRIVRHGVRKDGRPALMPSEDFLAMSDRELSDVVAYIRSLPPVDNVVPESTLGPIGTMLMATGKFRLSVDTIQNHDEPHALEPPEAAETVEFGRHLAQVCTGCHRPGFEGGPIVQGPPDWPPAKNLTPHQDGLAGWTFEEFERLMREGVKRDGEPIRAPMTLVTPFAANMTDTEIRALWLFIQSLEPTPTGG